ncbi:MAG: polysaccharide deacetylase family protein [Alicyclobacillus sp.]|nr:polysaccharide deacetylase family protein [Alicyclobacillus sp.]
MKSSAARRTASISIAGCCIALLAGCAPFAHASPASGRGKPDTAATNATSATTTPTADATATGPQPPHPTWRSDPARYAVTQTPHPNMSIAVPILEYHDADYVPGDIATLRPGQLDAEFAWLQQHHFHPINLGQLYAAFYNGYTLPPRPVVLTFDDGYESMYTKVLPLLEKYGFQATFFVVSGFTHANPAENNRRFPTLTVSELKALNQSPLVDIEDHTEHHQDLSKLSTSQQQTEILGDAAFLQNLTGHPIRYFCYPDGGYTAATEQILKHGGFLLATTQHQGYAKLSQGPLTPPPCRNSLSYWPPPSHSRYLHRPPVPLCRRARNATKRGRPPFQSATTRPPSPTNDRRFT